MLQKLLNAEPTAVRALIAAILTFLVSVGLVSQAHADSTISIVTAVLPAVILIANGYLTRNAVYSPKTTQAIADRAAATGNTDIGTPPAGPVPVEPPAPPAPGTPAAPPP